jgi:nitroimidazol reductase NimA-like FMN-containing flavoprotein (pyridoxamine 5'-phosphate oxidase superfamily)
MSNKRVDILTTAECRELLDRHHFGRLGFTNSVGVLPSIIPVNYLLDEDKIVIRTDAGSKLNAHSAVPRSRSRWTASTRPMKSAGASSSAVALRK